MEARRSGWSALALIRFPILIVLVALGTRGVVETDVWGHLKFGLDLLATHTLPSYDHYNFTSMQPWVNLEWLSDLLFASAYNAGGLPLLALLRAASVTCAVVVFSRYLRAVAWPLRDLLITLVIFVSLPLLAAVRPQIFSVPLYALTLLALRDDALWLPLVFALWANLHGGWLLGIGAAGVRTAMQPTRRRITVFVASVGATLLTPYGVSLWRSIADALSRGWSGISEWEPIWSLSTGAEGAVIWGLIAVACLWAAVRRIPARRWEWIWTIGVAIVSARARRHIPFFAITAAMLLFAHLRTKAAALADQPLTAPMAAILTVPVIAALFSGFVLLQPTLSCLPPQDPPVRPESSAVQFIRDARLRGRVLMWFDWGLYAVWHVGDQLKVSYDNRRETVYSADIVASHTRFYAGELPDYADQIHADYAWLPPDLPPVKQLEARGWHVLFRGPRSVILSRNEGPPLVTVTAQPKVSACFPDP